MTHQANIHIHHLYSAFFCDGHLISAGTSINNSREDTLENLFT